MSKIILALIILTVIAVTFFYLKLTVLSQPSDATLPATKVSTPQLSPLLSPEIKKSTLSTPSGPAQNYSSWSLNSSQPTPIWLLVTDSQGRQTGSLLKTGGIVQDIPRSSYALDEQAICDPSGEKSCMPGQLVFGDDQPNDGKYTVQIFGIEDGSYNLDFSSISTNGEMTNKTFAGTVHQGSIDKYIVTFSQSTGGVMQIVN